MSDASASCIRLQDIRLDAGQRVALALEYDGSAYQGWQAQMRPGTATVQETLQAALSQVAAAPVQLQCAGRTDAGVHASHQLVHFDSPSPRDAKAFVMGANALLPPSIAVKWAHPVASEFHARFSARARRYRYVILNRPLRSAHLPGLSTYYPHPLDTGLMQRDAQILLGEQDFSAFRGAGCQSRTAMRNVHFVEVRRSGDWVVVDIQANAFLLHMVRNIVGVLLAVGSGRAAPGWTRTVLASRDRTQGGVTARPQGLYLVDVEYDAEWNLPLESPGPAWLAEHPG